MELTILLASVDAILDILEVKASLDSCTACLAGIIGVILAAARSSTFLATAKVSTLLDLEKEMSNLQ